jgi:NTE family protein
MLRAVVERDIRPDLIVGTSVGALNAAFLAFDPSEHGVARLETIWRGLTDEDLFPGARFKTSWARMLMRGNKIFDSSGIRRLIESRLGSPRFEDARIPLAVVATELESGGEVVFSQGDLVDPLLASCAMPSIFPPVLIGNRGYIDGGVSNAVPVSPAIAMGASRIYVLNCSAGNQRPRPLLRPMDHLLHAFQLSRSLRWELEQSELAAKVELIEVPAPMLEVPVSFTSLAHTEAMLAAGYEHAAAFLDRPVHLPAVSQRP